jgi:hypothetical protein
MGGNPNVGVLLGTGIGIVSQFIQAYFPEQKWITPLGLLVGVLFIAWGAGLWIDQHRATLRRWGSRVEPWHLQAVGLAGIIVLACVALAGLIWERYYHPPSSSGPRAAAQPTRTAQAPPLPVSALPDKADEVSAHYHFGSSSHGLVGTATLLWEPSKEKSSLLRKGELIVSNFTGADSIMPDHGLELDAQVITATFVEPVGPFRVEASYDGDIMLGGYGNITENTRKRCKVSLRVPTSSVGLALEPTTIRLYFYRRTFDE